ncbi:MAG: hypothetical protein DRI84_01520 [Bacteroidetes bacterium]|nr:MAG: hypothetical protein DRI84_01520 [Bacteroidota bacterium]
MKSIALLFLSLSIIGNVYAQDLDDVFDDGGMSNIKNNVGINATDLVEGFLTIQYERYLGPHYAINLRGGPLVYDGIPMHLMLLFDNSGYVSYDDKFTNGFLMGLNIRVYMADHTGWFTSYDFMFTRRNSISERENTFTFAYIIGFKWNVYNRFSIIPSTGVGLGFQQLYPLYDPPNTYLTDDDRSFMYGEFTNFGFYFPIHINVAYDF